MKKLYNKHIRLTEEECLEIGGHCWNFHRANEVVNRFGDQQGSMNSVYYPLGEPCYRTCKHCGKRQVHKESWED